MMTIWRDANKIKPIGQFFVRALLVCCSPFFFGPSVYPDKMMNTQEGTESASEPSVNIDCVGKPPHVEHENNSDNYYICQEFKEKKDNLDKLKLCILM